LKLISVFLVFSGTQGRSQNVTIEEVSDEDQPATSQKKKKKKKPKKKKKKAASTAEEPVADTNGADEPVDKPETSQTPAPVPAPLTSPSSKQQKKTPAASKSAAKKAPSVNSLSSTTTLPVWTSTSSLTLPTENAAQSARSYLQQEGLMSGKSKVKTRSDQPALFDISEKTSIFSRFSKKEKETKPEPKIEQGDKNSFFSKMTKKTKAYMHQLLHTAEDEKQGIAPLKWEHFVRVGRSLEFCTFILTFS
jgi:hypothetical protein